MSSAADHLEIEFKSGNEVRKFYKNRFGLNPV